MLAPDKAPKQHWWLTRPDALEVAGYVAVFIVVFMLVYGLLK
jgi:hypothetical protein